MEHRPSWIRRAVVYQVYIRSFADANGDGVGDIAGIRARLGYLRSLGIDAVWITPWFPSPMEDGGYDVADYRGIDPLFGSIAEATELFAAAHEAGLRVLLDLVPNHTSARHPWFEAALGAPPGSMERGRYLFRDGRGPDGAEPPNNWQSAFGGSAWTRLTAAERAEGAGPQWYLHSFAPGQPDLDWSNAEVVDEFEAVLRHWFDLGVDGFRIDVASGLAKAAGLPDGGPPGDRDPGAAPLPHPQWDQDDVHEIYRRWRAIADGFPEPKVFIGEVHAPTPERLARYLVPDELHGAFCFPFLKSAWDAAALRGRIDEARTALAAVGALPTWVLANHDETRQVTRFARDGVLDPADPGPPLDPEEVARGRRRARAAALLMLALPGTASLYQGEELGLPEVSDLPDDALQDPIWTRSGNRIRGRDGCRVPIPWSAAGPPYGYGPAGSTPWLPQPPGWGDLSVERQEGDPDSTLSLYRAAIAVRRDHPGFRDESFRWVDGRAEVLEFERGGGVRCVVNIGTEAVPLPASRTTLVTSAPTEGDRLPVDAACWYAPSDDAPSAGPDR